MVAWQSTAWNAQLTIRLADEPCVCPGKPRPAKKLHRETAVDG
jgi:hypothetical protein